MRLTLRTLLAYLDDTLEPHEARDLGQRVSQSEFARELVERIKKATRRRGLATPSFATDGDVSDPNIVAEYLSDALPADQVERVEENCLSSDAHLAEIAACHQILTLVLTEPVRVPPTANRRMYKLVRKPASQPDRKPGRTMPISGSIPLDDPTNVEEHDAALLLGMRRYTPGGPIAARVLQGVLVAGLAVCLLVALIMALPSKPPRTPLLSSDSIALAPTPPPATKSGTTVAMTTPKPIEVAKPLLPPPTPMDMPALTLAPPPRLVDDAGPAKLPEPVVPAAPLPPREARKVIGKLDSPDQVVVVAKASPDGAYERLTSQHPDVSTDESIVCLPGYKAKVRLTSGVLIELWSSTPEQHANVSVLETRVRFHEPPEGYDADLTIRTGRIFVNATKPGGAKVRVRVAEEAWDATLADDKSEVLFEVVTTTEPGVPFLKDVPDSPRIAVAVAITKGTVGLSLAGTKDFGTAPAPRFYIWDNKADGIEESNDRDRLGYFTRFPTAPPDVSPLMQTRALAMQKVLSDQASSLKDRAGLKTRVAELISDEGDFSAVGREMAARYAVYAAAAIDEPVYLVQALNSGLKPFLRNAASFTLDRWLPVLGDNTTRFYQQLMAKQFGEESALTVIRLLRRYTADDLRRPETLDQLVSLMETNEHPAVRELAFWTLITAVDPTALENTRLSRFDAGGSREEREPVINAWRARLVDIKKRNAEGKKP